ncbi:hypothetical protein [Mycobacterium sp. 1165178.9]|uniref:hypothetical protein n=1 Tax=Mycobacterium sp. 1165178.9 TaxID=1834070 RepID=UPI0007FC6B5D|nr:hypothetical protein [Mycobacterium sp. 1165178.9]OBK80346.1 hypothetical protein A5652_18125 [Mycobacterium sp. 1165178.9]
MSKTIHSTHYKTVVAKEFEILVDTDEDRGPVIGLKVNPHNGRSFIMPITFPAAKAVAMDILKTLLFAAPELF